MVNFEEIKKRFNEGCDYTVSHKDNKRKTIYTILLPELKQILFADEVRGGVNIIEADCIVEYDVEGNFRKSFVASSRGYNYPRFSENQGLTFAPFLDSLRKSRIPTYDESGRLLTDQREIEAEVEKRRDRKRQEEVGWKNPPMTDKEPRFVEMPQVGDSFDKEMERLKQEAKRKEKEADEARKRLEEYGNRKGLESKQEYHHFGKK